jgi:hypothetical protein
VGLLLPGAGYAQDAQDAEATESTSAGWQHHTLAAFDAVVIRPLGFVAIVVGAAFVVPVVLVTWPTGRETIDEATERFVMVPVRSVFERPLGDF